MGPASRWKEVEDQIFNVSMSSYINVGNVFCTFYIHVLKILEIHPNFLNGKDEETLENFI